MKEIRCSWANQGELDKIYHDTIWGRPEHEDQKLFKMLLLEGQQAGLSWSTIVKKMDNFCEAYDHFDPTIIVKYDDKKVEELLQNPGIIRNQLKIRAAIKNAKAFLEVQEKYGSFDCFIWSYVKGVPIQNAWEKMEDVPANTSLSDQISKDLKKLGFTFVGSTIVYAYMQAIGMVNDHLTSCICYQEVKEEGKSKGR